MRFIALCLLVCTSCYTVSARDLQTLGRSSYERELRIARLEEENRLLRQVVRRISYYYEGMERSLREGDAGVSFPRTDAAVHIP